MVKTKSMRIRLTEEEWNSADSASTALFGTPNKSRLMRKLLRDYIGMGPDLTDKEITAFREAIKQLTGMARNLNQITARINSDNKQVSQLSPDYIRRLSSLVREVNEQLKGYVSQTINRYQEVVNHGEQ
ncbi:plasmid mobilization relaxosome protein MobC [Legionella tunisiensis]|uniref:plasmid mobilization relaxosome protein MobC n=1 Tax=Legionella tunisiensis TaxID=1034944 RepID=UPI0002FB7474|nr:plasmid mobilization relaxosome protein MobC [Legionella tunisiensis]